MQTQRFLALLGSILLTLLFTLPVQAATIRPNVTEDGFDAAGKCTFRDAVQSVNTQTFSGGCEDFSEGSLANNNTIILEAKEYLLTLDGPGENGNETGDIDINLPVLILGAGQTFTTVKANFSQGEEDRVIDIDPNGIISGLGVPGVLVALVGFEVTNGLASTGGGILNHLFAQNAGGPSLAALQSMSVRDNAAEGGGGISNQGILAINQSNITQNDALQGGGLLQPGVALIDESTFDSNTAVFGGGIATIAFSPFSATVISNSTVSRNKALLPAMEVAAAVDGFGSGGGIFHVVCAPLVLINSTISSNQADVAGGGVYNDQDCEPFGPPPEPLPTVPNLYFNVTVANNRVLDEDGQGGGIFYFFIPPQPGGVEAAQVPTGVPILWNTLLAKNLADLGPDCFTFLLSNGFNLLGSTAECVLNPLTAAPDKKDIANVGLGSLADNGGFTQTHGLLAGSPAIDMGNPQGCDAPDPEALLVGMVDLVELMRDQRNFARPIAVLDPTDPICDVGAYEFQTFDFSVSKDDGVNNQGIPSGQEFQYTISIFNNGPGDAANVTLSDPLPAAVDFVSVLTTQGTCSESGGTVSCDIGTVQEGVTVLVTITVIAREFGMHENVATVTLNNPAQQQITLMAEETTFIIGGELFGSGCDCRLGPVPEVPASILAFYLLAALAVMGTWVVARRRIR